MECPHLNESVVLTAPPTTNGSPPSLLCCTVCGTNRNPWICLTCGIVNCGRYVNGHALQHFQDDHRHCVCLDCNSYAVYCYSCDDFVYNDTDSKKIECARKLLQEIELVYAQTHFENNEWESSELSLEDISREDTYRTVIIEVPDASCAQVVEERPSDGGSNVIERATPLGNELILRDVTEDKLVIPFVGRDTGYTSARSSDSKENREHLDNRENQDIAWEKKDRLNKDNNQENKHDLRRRKSTEAAENNKKRLKIDDGAKLVRPRTSGLRNLGNTCFMNAVLQSLSNIQHFCGYIKQLPSLESKLPKKKPSHRKTRDSNGEENVMLIEELRKTLVALWQGSKTAISPESLFSVIWKVVPRFSYITLSITMMKYEGGVSGFQAPGPGSSFDVRTFGIAMLLLVALNKQDALLQKYDSSRGYQQQDAHEFMRYLLDRLHTELLTLLPYPNLNSPFIGPKGKSTIVTAIFGGILQNEVKCLICGIESKKHDPFLDLSLDIPPHFTAKTPKPKEGESLCTLQDCLKSFTDVEELEESELYMCSNCKQKQRSTKKFWIRRLPNVLCLHLKRFRWSTYFRVKVETYVQFPLRGLEMTRFVLNNLHETRGNSTGSNGYDLAAVIVHHGSGAGSGHYTAYATHEGLWYHFNDSTVTVCEEDIVARCKAYILFYVRRQVKVPDHLSADQQ